MKVILSYYTLSQTRFNFVQIEESSIELIDRDLNDNAVGEIEYSRMKIF